MSLTPLVLAAGQGSRFGQRSKLLADLGGKPVLAWVFDALLAAGLDHGLVALPDDARQTDLSALVPTGYRPVLLAQDSARIGMGLSLAALARQVPAGQDALVVLGDQPLVSAADLRALLDAPRDGRIRRLAHAGKGAHPVLFPAALVPELHTLTGDAGARAVIGQQGCALVEVNDPAVLCDVDTPEALEALRSRV